MRVEALLSGKGMGVVRVYPDENDGSAVVGVSLWAALSAELYPRRIVPEGMYTVRVDDAREVVRELQADPNGFEYSKPRYKETTVKSYGKCEAPFKVESDMTGMTLPIPGAAAH